MSQGFSNPEPSSSVWVLEQCEVTLRDPSLSPRGVGSVPELPSLPQPCSRTSETVMTHANLKRVVRPFCRLIAKSLDCGLFTFASEDRNRDSVLAVVTRLWDGSLSVTEKRQRFFTSPKRLGRHWDPTQPVTERVRWGLPGDKAIGA